jgi:hypothetical protein
VTLRITALVASVVLSLAVGLFPGAISVADELPTAWLLGSWEGTEGTRTTTYAKIEFSKQEDVIRWKWNRKSGSGASFEADCEGIVTKLTESGIEMEGKYVYHTNLRHLGKPVKLWLNRADEVGMNGHAIGSDNATWPISLKKAR